MDTREFHEMYQLEDTHWWFVTKRKFIQVILQGKKFSRILDIGCGTGKNLEILSKYGKTYGIDPSPLAIKYCHQRHLKNLQLATINSMKFPENYFDLITLFDVLSHKSIVDDHQAISKLCRIIKPHGYLLITDVAFQFLWGPHDLAFHEKKRYSRFELISLLNQSGFKIKKASYYFCSTFPLLVINRLFKKIIYKNKHASDVNQVQSIINCFFIWLYKFELQLFKKINLPFGSSIIILAQK
mgnify:CR=1 FL=1